MLVWLLRSFPGVSSDVRVAASALGDTDDCVGGDVLVRFAGGGGMVSISGCRGGSRCPGFCGRGGCFGSVWVCFSVCLVALK